MIFLVDYNLDGYALVFLGILTKLGWLELLSIQFMTFRDVGLSMDSGDITIAGRCPACSLPVRGLKSNQTISPRWGRYLFLPDFFTYWFSPIIFTLKIVTVCSC